MNTSGNNVLKYCKPKNFAENIFFKFRDFKNKQIIEKCIKDYNLLDYDIYHFDGGMDLYRDVRFAKQLKDDGKKIVCCYFGSDLRSRGIFKELDEISDLNLTVEFDHRNIHSAINYIYFPFDTESYSFKINKNKILKIIHSPTNRLFKGTDKIIPVIEDLKKEIKIDFILAENMDRNSVLKIKSECDLSIDQVGGLFGGTGYGKNSIENLSMGIPTITEFTDEYLNFINNNPFIHTKIDNLRETIINLNSNREMLENLAINGRKWVESIHSFDAVNRRLNELYTKYEILK
jgi:glycosyltransferase involved in cell wall biosynthesis